MVIQFFSGNEIIFIINIIISIFAGFVIGAERELRGKPAGISTHSLVILGAMLFSFISLQVDPMSTSRIAAQVITGVGFIGAGMILRNEEGLVVNLTTAASIWFAAAIGMAIGFGMYSISIIGIIAAFFVPRIPSIGKQKPRRHD